MKILIKDIKNKLYKYLLHWQKQKRKKLVGLFLWKIFSTSMDEMLTTTAMAMAMATISTSTSTAADLICCKIDI